MQNSDLPFYVYKLSVAEPSASVRGRSADGRDESAADDESPVGTTVALSPSVVSPAPDCSMSIRCMMTDRPGGAKPLRNVSFMGVCTSKMDDCWASELVRREASAELCGMARPSMSEVEAPGVLSPAASAPSAPVSAGVGAADDVSGDAESAVTARIELVEALRTAPDDRREAISEASSVSMSSSRLANVRWDLSLDIWVRMPLPLTQSGQEKAG